MTQTDALLKIGEFAKLARTNLRTLRYYEELELLRPASRSEGGFRYYRPTDVHRLEMIRGLQELGLHLDRIRELMDTRSGRPSRAEFLCRVRAALAEQDRLVLERIAALEAQRGKIAEAAAKLSQCETCAHQPRPENNFCEPCTHTGLPLPEHVSALF